MTRVGVTGQLLVAGTLFTHKLENRQEAQEGQGGVKLWKREASIVFTGYFVVLLQTRGGGKWRSWDEGSGFPLAMRDSPWLEPSSRPASTSGNLREASCSCLWTSS